MGHEIEKIALNRNHSIVAFPDREDDWASLDLSPGSCEAVIDFSTPASAAAIVKRCLISGIPVVSGTTGWPDELEKIRALCKSLGGTFFYAPNFSIGVNIFFELNRKLATLLNGMDYSVEINEIHHIHKLDAPSGTAIALAGDIVKNNARYTAWNKGLNGPESSVPVASERSGEVPGTHTVSWSSEADSIELKHTAYNRSGFATGAVLAAEWIQGRKGVFGMQDLLNYGR